MQGVVEVVIYRERIINHVNNTTLLRVRQKMIIPLEKKPSRREYNEALYLATSVFGTFLSGARHSTIVFLSMSIANLPCILDPKGWCVLNVRGTMLGNQGDADK